MPSAVPASATCAEERRRFLKSTNKSTDKRLKSLKKALKEQGKRITKMEKTLEQASVYKRLYAKARKTKSADRNPKQLLSRKITDGRQEKRDIRGFSDKKWASLEEWEAMYEMEEDEKDERKQAIEPHKKTSRKTAKGEDEERDNSFSHKKWRSFQKWEFSYDADLEKKKNTKQSLSTGKRKESAA